jgi:Spy/CpxP family protein refolding chaperone
VPGGKHSEKEEKMKVIKKLTTVFAAVIILAVALAAKAGGFGPDFPGRDMGPGLMGLEKLLELNLSDSQETELLTILHKYKDEIERVRNRSIAASKKLATVIHTEEFDENELRKAFREVSSLREESLVLMAKMISELKKVLTQEQRVLLNDRKAQIFGMIKGLLAE